MADRRFIGGAWGTMALAVLAGCASAIDAGPATPPRAKPDTIPVRLEGPTADAPLLASVATRSGEMLILEPDGSVTATSLDSPRGRQALASSDAELLRLQDVLVTDDSVIPANMPLPPSAQQLALEEFAARSGPALPARIVAPDPAAFLGTRVSRVAAGSSGQDGGGGGGGGGGELVAVLVNTREGVDESAAFAYATCTLAAWSKSTDTPFGRHIRTLSRKRGEVLAVEAIFTMSRTRPLGLRVMEQGQTLRDCEANGIPAGGAAARGEGTGRYG